MGVVIETASLASLAEAKLAEYCRKKGRFVEQIRIRAWRQAREGGAYLAAMDAHRAKFFACCAQSTVHRAVSIVCLPVMS